MTESDFHARRIVEEFCAAVGFPERAVVELLLSGEAISVYERPVRLIREAADPDYIYVYIDLGVLADVAGTHERMLRINFLLCAGKDGVLSLHPTNNHALYAFRYPLVPASTGRDLVQRLLRAIGSLDAEQFPTVEATAGKRV